MYIYLVRCKINAEIKFEILLLVWLQRNLSFVVYIHPCFRGLFQREHSMFRLFRHTISDLSISVNSLTFLIESMWISGLTQVPNKYQHLVRTRFKNVMSIRLRKSQKEAKSPAFASNNVSSCAV